MTGVMRISSRIKRIAWAAMRAVGHELALLITVMVTLLPQSVVNINSYVVRRHVLPDWLPEILAGSVGIALVAGIATALAVGLIRNRRAKRAIRLTIYVVIFTLWAVTLFIVNNFNAIYTPQMLTVVAETNGGEASEFLAAWLFARGTVKATVLWLLTLGGTLLLERYKYAISRRIARSRVALFVLCLITLIVGAWGLRIGSKLVRPYNSLYELEITESRLRSNDVITRLHQSAVMLHFQKQETRAAINLNLQAVNSERLTCDRDSLTIVLVVGESFNKYHSSLYGYRLPTSPLMTAERDSGNLTVFTDVLSPYNLTSAAIKNMLSLNDIASREHWHEVPLWVSLLRRAGYSVAFWDNQRDFNAASVFTFSLNSFLFAPEMVENIYTAVNDSTFAFDGDFVANFARYAAGDTASLRFHLLHLMGQHTKYDNRYPADKSLQRFTAADYPADPPYLDEAHRSTIAAYDNATLYNDSVLWSIINLYRNSNAVIIMLSDHGEEVYDYRDFMERDHNPEKDAMMVKYENEIPFFIWCSQDFKQRNPDVMSRLATASRCPIMTDNLGQIILLLAGIDCRYCRPERNPLSPRFKPAQHPLYRF